MDNRMGFVFMVCGNWKLHTALYLFPLTLMNHLVVWHNSNILELQLVVIHAASIVTI